MFTWLFAMRLIRFGIANLNRLSIGPAEAPLIRATSSRNAGRHHLGMPGEIKSEWWATSSRNAGRDQIGMVGDIIADSRATSPGIRNRQDGFRERQFNHDYKGHVLVPRCKL